MREFTFPDKTKGKLTEAMWRKLRKRFSAKPIWCLGEMGVSPFYCINISCPLCDIYVEDCYYCPVYFIEGVGDCDWIFDNCDWIFDKCKLPSNISCGIDNIYWPTSCNRSALAFLKRMVTWLESMKKV